MAVDIVGILTVSDTFDTVYEYVLLSHFNDNSFFFYRILLQRINPINSSIGFHLCRKPAYVLISRHFLELLTIFLSLRLSCMHFISSWNDRYLFIIHSPLVMMIAYSSNTGFDGVVVDVVEMVKGLE